MTAVTTIKPHLSAVRCPAELRTLPAWVMWRFEQHEDEPKPRKVPYYVTGQKRYGKQGAPDDRLSLTFGSVCSGIEAASVAWHPLGWRAAWLAEIEPFPCAVLAHRYPDVENVGDMTLIPDRIALGVLEAPDVFCGGTPCQAFSVAGLRRSLGDARGNLSLIFCEIANAIDDQRRDDGKPACIVFWENVPGVLTTKDNAFGCFLAGIAGEDDPLQPPGGKWSDAGYVHGPARAVAWRTLDAQYFGLAQRRRRVFVVASAREDFDPAAVLFEFDGVRRDTAPSREAGQAIAQCLTTGTGKRYDPETETLLPHGGGLGVEPIAFSHVCQAAQLPTAGGRDTGVHNPMTCGQVPAVAFPWQSSFAGATDDGLSGTLIKNQTMAACTGAQVRRLTPRECERLQGFPTVSEKAIIEVCLDPQNHGALAALKCHKWQNSAWPADVSGLTQPASIAGIHSSTHQAGQEPLAALHVQLLYGHTVRVTRNAGRSILYASGAEASAKSHQSTQIENTAAALAQPLHEVVSEAALGKAESHHSIRLSFPALSGATSAEKSGQGTEGHASDAESGQKQATFTTSDLGLITTSCDSTAATLCCSALRAIAGCIPSETLPARFSIELTVESPYTAIPWRGKPADECPDGPRYKALGNSWAVPVVRWIGQRIVNHLGALA